MSLPKINCNSIYSSIHYMHDTDIVLARVDDPRTVLSRKEQTNSDPDLITIHTDDNQHHNKINHHNTESNNNTCQANTSVTAAISATCRISTKSTRNLHKHILQINSYYIFLLIFFAAILVQISSSTPVTLSGRRLILHTTKNRQYYHQQLLQQQRSQVQTTPSSQRHHHHHHLHSRSVGRNMAEAMCQPDELITDNENYCQAAKRALSTTLRQANATFSFVRLSLDDFTRQKYQKTPEEVQDEWRVHNAELQHPISQYLIREIDVTPDDGHFERIHGSTMMTRNRLTCEMQKIYTTLKTLNAAFEQLSEYRQHNSSRALHNMYDNMEAYKSINEFLLKIQQHVHIDLQETVEAMRMLNIPIPSDSVIDQFVPKPPAPEWVLTKEHLSVMQYLRGFYKYLLKNCGGAEAL